MANPRRKPTTRVLADECCPVGIVVGGDPSLGLAAIGASVTIVVGEGGDAKGASIFGEAAVGDGALAFVVGDGAVTSAVGGLAASLSGELAAFSGGWLAAALPGELAAFSGGGLAAALPGEPAAFAGGGPAAASVGGLAAFVGGGVTDFAAGVAAVVGGLPLGAASACEGAVVESFVGLGFGGGEASLIGWVVGVGARAFLGAATGVGGGEEVAAFAGGGAAVFSLPSKPGGMMALLICRTEIL